MIWITSRLQNSNINGIIKAQKTKPEVEIQFSMTSRSQKSQDNHTIRETWHDNNTKTDYCQVPAEVALQ